MMNDEAAFEEARRLMRDAALFDTKNVLREIGGMNAGDGMAVVTAMVILLAERTKMLPQ